MQKRGKFIVVDGCEGAGKTTAIKSLPESLNGHKINITHEPGGTPFADKIRALILSEDAHDSGAETMFGLMWGARAEHLKNKIIPALSRGETVICDRFDSSTYAYQIKAQGAGHLKDLFWQTRKAYLGEAVPDLYLFFDVEPSLGLQRVSERNEAKTHFDERRLEFHALVREGFKEFLREVPHKIIDANRDIVSVRDDFLEAVADLLSG